MSIATRAEKAGDDRLGIVEAEEKEMKEGIIVLFHARKMWGFIREKDGVETFFHVDNCTDGFKPELGAVVEFKLAPPLRLGQRDQAVQIRAGGAL